MTPAPVCSELCTCTSTCWPTQVLRVVDHDHRAVGQVAHALALVLAFADDAQGEHFAGQQDHAQRFGQVVQVDVIDRLQLGDFAQVVIVGESLARKLRARRTSLASTSFSSGKSPSWILTSLRVLRWMRLSISRPRRPRARLMGSLESAICCSSLQHEPRHDDEALEEIGLDQVGDAAIDDDAGIEQQEVVRLVLRREADVGDDEREILFVAAHGQDDADVAEAENRPRRMSQRAVSFDVFEQAGRSMSRATTVPSSRPKVVAEKARREKPFSISSTAIISQPKPKPIIMPRTLP